MKMQKNHKNRFFENKLKYLKIYNSVILKEGLYVKR